MLGPTVELGAYLGGAWVVISGARTRATVSINYIRRLITPLISTYEPPSRNEECHWDPSVY